VKKLTLIMVSCLFWASAAQAAPTLAQWLGQPKAERAQAIMVMAKTWDNQDHMIPVVNGQLAELPPYYIPYQDLYNLYQAAIDAKDVNFIKLLNQKMVPAGMVLEELLELVNGPYDRDWAKCKRLAQVLEIRDEYVTKRATYEANGELLMPNMYFALGGCLLPTPDLVYFNTDGVRSSNYSNMGIPLKDYLWALSGYEVAFPRMGRDKDNQYVYEYCLDMFPECSKRR